jgi:hypothetical protein
MVEKQGFLVIGAFAGCHQMPATTRVALLLTDSTLDVQGNFKNFFF